MLVVSVMSGDHLNKAGERKLMREEILSARQKRQNMITEMSEEAFLRTEVAITKTKQHTLWFR